MAEAEDPIRLPDTSMLCTKYFIVPCTRCGAETNDTSKAHTFNRTSLDKVTKIFPFPLCFNCASMEWIHGAPRDIK